MRSNRDIIDKELAPKSDEHSLTDSLQLERFLAEALDISTQNIHKDIYFEEYNRKLENGSNVKIKINLDYHFTKSHPHLIIHRYSIGDIYIDIFSKKNNVFENTLSHKEWSVIYTNDTIQDINGDSYADLVINGYGSSGCCLNSFSKVYLFRESNNSFFGCFDFLNPTFSPKEKIIRGVGFGQPGFTEMYKYKWNGEKVDTIEYVYYERNKKYEKTGTIIISDAYPHNDNHKVLKRLKYIPSEYRKIYGFDWFTGEGYE